MHKPRIIEVFAGAGLFGASFKSHGFRPVFAAENDPRAVGSFNRNVAPVAEVWDVNRVRQDHRCEVLVAGPPCQGFSSLGGGIGKKERNRLSLAIVSWAISTEAKVVVIENVPQFLDSWYWKRIKSRMLRHGFESVDWILSAEKFGVPQLRTRAFAVLSRIGLPDRPRPRRLEDSVTTVREAFDGLSVKPDKTGMHVASKPSEIAMARFREIPRRGDKRDVMRTAPHLCPPSWFRMGSNATDVWGRMDYDRPSNTVRCAFQNASKGRYIHPTANRVITLREGARLQTVPDSWEFVGDRTSVARQIGNGVPLELGKAVATEVARLF